MTAPRRAPLAALAALLVLVVAAILLADRAEHGRPSTAPPPTPSPAPPPAPTPAPSSTAATRLTLRAFCELLDADPPRVVPLDPTGARPGSLRACPRRALVRFGYTSPRAGALFLLTDVAGELTLISPPDKTLQPGRLEATETERPLPVRLRPPLPEGGPQVLLVVAPDDTTAERVLAAARELRSAEAIGERLSGLATVLSVPTQ